MPRFPRLFAPAVLAASLLFLAVSDASASCLAAWLCPPPAVHDCEGASSSRSAWTKASDTCAFEARVDRASQKLERAEVKLFVASAAANLAFFEALEAPAAPPVRDLPGRGPPLPLYRIQQALLL